MTENYLWQNRPKLVFYWQQLHNESWTWALSIFNSRNASGCKEMETGLENALVVQDQANKICFQLFRWYEDFLVQNCQL